MLRVFCCLICFIFLSCSQTQKHETYFGGGIVHPKADHVLLFKDNKLVDSIKLDGKGHFHYKFNLEEPALFTFRHAYEPQSVFFNPGDSLKLRLNTLEFDASLVFSGEGAVENNFLIENYLLNQKNTDLIFSYYKIDPKEFEVKTDSIKSFREQKLEHLSEKHKLSEEFIKIAQKSIDFEFYDMRERYAFLLNKYNPDKAINISSDFFEYRKNIDFNDKDVIYLFGYQRFLDNYLKNRSIKICQQQKDSSDCYNLSSHSNLDDRIDLVDSLIKIEHLRNNYFERFIKEEIIYAQTPENLKHTEQLINKFNFSEKEKTNLKSLVAFQSAILVDSDLKEVVVKCTNMKEHKLGDIMNKEKGIVYSWTVQSPSHHKLRIKKINSLKKKYPDVKFIGINIDYNFPDKWLDAVNKYDHNYDNEYIIKPEENTAFYRNYLNKVFFIDKNCIIKKSEIIIRNRDLEKHIQEFIEI
jgi:hypothetical protein